MLITEERSPYENFKHFHISEEPETLIEAEEYFNWICENRSKPYLINLGDCVDKDLIGENNTRYNDGRLIDYVVTLLDGIDGPTIDKNTFSEETMKENQNKVYHCCKIMYLIDQYRTVGLDSTIQGVIEGKHMFIHPGMSRIYALWYLKTLEEDVVMWDTNETFSDRTPLTFEEWKNIFMRVKDKTFFIASVEGEILEMHMQEDRPTIVNSTEDIKSMFDNKLPVLRGVGADDIMPYVRTEGVSGVAIEAKNGYTLKLAELTEILGLYPESCERIEKENFSIYKI
jgi:hypothetical protein